jgi:hypothetical protein
MENPAELRAHAINFGFAFALIEDINSCLLLPQQPFKPCWVGRFPLLKPDYLLEDMIAQI